MSEERQTLPIIRPVLGTEEADAARHTQRQTEEMEAHALPAAFDMDNVGQALRRRELLFLIALLGHCVERTAETMSHALSKLG